MGVGGDSRGTDSSAVEGIVMSGTERKERVTDTSIRNCWVHVAQAAVCDVTSSNYEELQRRCVIIIPATD